jgi:4-diphosphocytidyl-2-C-methyl-D-erythritol kinase
MASMAAPDSPSSSLQPFPGLAVGPRRRIIWAPAKVNLFLEVLRKRPDGYHDLATAMIAVNLYDTIEFERTPDASLSLTCDSPELTTGPENLVLRAAKCLQDSKAVPFGARIHLSKRIPTQAGLGGGSSDAAATLAALNALWNLNLSREELAPLAAQLGSDVAFFLGDGPAWCTGRGEIVEPLRTPQRFHLVIVKPSVGLSTPLVYQRLTVPAEPTSGDAVRAALAAGDAAALGASLFNRLQAPAFDLQPIVKTVYDAVRTCDPLGCLLSGSGSSVFALCRDARDAHRVARECSTRLAALESLDPIPRVIVASTRGARSHTV